MALAPSSFFPSAAPKTVDDLIAAIRSKTSYTSSEPIIAAQPELLSQAGSEGKTPVQVAYELGRVALLGRFKDVPAVAAAVEEFLGVRRARTDADHFVGLLAKAVRENNFLVIEALSKIPGNFDKWLDNLRPAYDEYAAKDAEATGLRSAEARDLANKAERIYDCFYAKVVIAYAHGKDFDSLAEYQTGYAVNYDMPTKENIVHALVRESDNVAVLKILLERGIISPNVLTAKNAEGKTPLELAISAHEFEFAKELLTLVPAATKSPDLIDALKRAETLALANVEVGAKELTSLIHDAHTQKTAGLSVAPVLRSVSEGSIPFSSTSPVSAAFAAARAAGHFLRVAKAGKAAPPAAGGASGTTFRDTAAASGGAGTRHAETGGVGPGVRSGTA